MGAGRRGRPGPDPAQLPTSHERIRGSMSSGTWTTTNGGAKVTVSASGVGALIAVGYALTHPHQASEAGGAGRGGGRGGGGEPAGSRQPASLLRANPNAIPVREIAAIAAPAQPVINIHLGDALGAFLREQAVPAYRVTAEHVEQQQEIGHG